MGFRKDNHIMTISINTSDYTNTKNVKIDGIDFKVRPMNSSETLAYMQVAQSLSSISEKEPDIEDIKKADKAVSDILDIFCSIFDKPEEAKAIFKNVPSDKYFEIYDKIMKGEE